MRDKLIQHFTTLSEELKVKNLPMPIEAQVDYILKKYKITTYDIAYKETDANGEYVQDRIENKVLLCFNDVVIKYRPHLHMGDYWLDIFTKNEKSEFTFYYLVELINSTKLVRAYHPHLQNGKPCFGSFEPEIRGALKEGNFIRFMSQMKAYLAAYYGRSVYRRGNVWSKKSICWSLHSRDEIKDMFGPEVDDINQLDIHGIAIDPTRWNFPKDMPARGSFLIQGQEQSVVNAYINGEQNRNNRYSNRSHLFDHTFPYFSHNYRGNYYSTWDDPHISKMFGYVHLCMQLGEMPLIHALEFTRIFLLTMFLEYTGEFDEESQKQLQEMTNRLNNSYGNTWKVNNRYQVKMLGEHETLLTKLRRQCNEVGNLASISETFFKNVKYGGHKLGQFLVLLRKKAPNKAKCKTFIDGDSKLTFDYTDYMNEYNQLEKHAYTQALQQLEKDKRGFVNAINKSTVIHTASNGEQSSLLFEEL